MSNPGDPRDTPKKKTLLLQKLLEEGTETFYREDCPECGGENVFIKDPEYLYEVPEHGISQILPTWVCSQCGYEALEDSGLETILNLLEVKKGTSYIKHEVLKGNPIKRIIH